MQPSRRTVRERFHQRLEMIRLGYVIHRDTRVFSFTGSVSSSKFQTEFSRSSSGIVYFAKSGPMGHHFQRIPIRGGSDGRLENGTATPSWLTRSVLMTGHGWIISVM